MNCFQNCIFTYDSQHSRTSQGSRNSCELLSELYFYLWFPTRQKQQGHWQALWIAFRIVFLLMIPNLVIFSPSTRVVVNCFQNCIFTYDSQPKLTLSGDWLRCELLSELYFYLWFPTFTSTSKFTLRCELLSELYFYLWFPTSGWFLILSQALWIAFRIVFLLMIPNWHWWEHKWKIVVNCFQNCIFTYDSQQSNKHIVNNICCELLSELYFYLWFPT